MAKFTYLVEEILRRKVTVEAESAGAAWRIVQQQYTNEEIVLNADDFQDYGIYLQGVDYGTDNSD